MVPRFKFWPLIRFLSPRSKNICRKHKSNPICKVKITSTDCIGRHLGQMDVIVNGTVDVVVAVTL